MEIEFLIGIIIAFIILVFVQWHFFAKKKKKTPFEYKTIAESNFAKTMLASYLVFGVIFGLGMINSSFSTVFIFPVIIGTFLISFYFATMRKKWSILAWGFMSISALAVIFLDMDSSQMSLIGLFGLVIVVITLHVFNKEKNMWT